MTDVHIGQLTSRIETIASPLADDAFVARVTAEVTRQLREAGELARDASLEDLDVFGDAAQEAVA